MHPPTRVLMVEDLASDAELAKREVERVLNRPVFSRVETRDEFIAALQSFCPDLILCDFKLPQFDGLSALALSRALAPDIPFIIVTGSMNEDTAVDCMKAGAWDYVIKEHLKRLGPAVSSVLRQRELRQQERAAEERARQWERVFDRAMFGLSIHNAYDNTFLDVNETFASEHGYTPEELRGEPLSLVHVPEEVALIAQWREVIARDGHASFECTHLRKDGSRFPVLMDVTSIFNESGQPVSRIACTINVEARVRAENALKESEARFRRAIEEAPFPIIIHAEDGAVLTLSHSWLEVTGYTREELPTIEHWTRLAYQDRSPDVLAVIQDVYSLTKRKAEGEFSIRCKDGSERIWEFSSVGLGRLPDNRRIAISMAFDVTERKRAEAERERLLTAVEQAQEVILITDPSGVIQYVNPVFERVTGYSREEALGRRPNLLKSGHHPLEFYHDMWSTLASGGVWRGRLVNRRKDGKEFVEEATISPVFDEQRQIVHFAAVKREITQELRIQEQLLQSQKMETIGRLAGGVAHDFNNLLTVINGYSQLLLDRTGNLDPHRTDLEAIRQAGERASALTRQLLALSRKQMLQPVALDLNRLVAELKPILSRLVGEDIELVLDLEPVAGTVYADASQMEQVLLNLVVNSREAMPRGGRISIATRLALVDGVPDQSFPGIPAGRYWCLCVSDNGSGIPPEVLPHIFEPFFSTKEEGRGTGLGLSTVQGIVVQSGGQIRADSQPGVGARFTIYLPLQDRAAVPTPGIEPVVVPRGRETLLLVEDMDHLRDFAAHVLSTFGYQVIPARDPQEALKAVRSEGRRIHLLLTDVVLPGINGWDLAQDIQSAYPHIKCLFMTGYSSDVIYRFGLSADAPNLIQKPFTAQQLAAKVRATLGPPSFSGRILVLDDEPGVRGYLRALLEFGGFEVHEAGDAHEAIDAARRHKPHLLVSDLRLRNQTASDHFNLLRKEIPDLRVIAISGAFSQDQLHLLEIVGVDAVFRKPLDPERFLSRVTELVSDVLRTEEP